MSGTCIAHQRQSSKNKAARLARRASKKTEINRTKKMARAAARRAADKIRVLNMAVPRGTARALRRAHLQPVQ